MQRQQRTPGGVEVSRTAARRTGSNARGGSAHGDNGRWQGRCWATGREAGGAAGGGWWRCIATVPHVQRCVGVQCLCQYGQQAGIMRCGHAPAMGVRAYGRAARAQVYSVMRWEGCGRWSAGARAWRAQRAQAPLLLATSTT